MTADPPLYQKVLSLLSARITAGTWPVGARLKDEPALATELSVSRGTLRRAVKELVRRGALHRVKGRGTFVVTNRIGQPLASRLISFAEAMEEQGLSFTTAVLSLRTEVPQARERSLLEMRPGERAYVIERVRSVDGAPVAYLCNWVPRAVCPRLTRRTLETAPLFSLLEQGQRHRIEWGRRALRAVAAAGAPARALKVARGAPLLLLEQTVYSTRAVPLECSRVWIDSRRMEIASVLQR